MINIPLKKLCSYSGCRELVDYGLQYCIKHKDIAEQQRKDSYKAYKARRTDKREEAFYNSGIWINTREQVLIHYKGMDLFEYYINNTIIPANLVHHIVEVKDAGGWDNRLEFNNLFPCNLESHNTIHAAYNKSKTSKEDMQRLLFSLIERYKNEFGID